MSGETRHEGGCLCGAVRYRIVGPLRDVVVCHCSRCRRADGHVAAYADCATADLGITAHATLRWYVADERRRGFCADCGASLFWQRDDDPQTMAIAAGTLDPPTGLRTVAQIFTATLGDYYQSAGEGSPSIPRPTARAARSLGSSGKTLGAFRTLRVRNPPSVSGRLACGAGTGHLGLAAYVRGQLAESRRAADRPRDKHCEIRTTSLT